MHSDEDICTTLGRAVCWVVDSLCILCGLVIVSLVVVAIWVLDEGLTIIFLVIYNRCCC